MSKFDNSDYDSTRTNLLNLLPEVLKSDTNKSIFETLFNRFFTKNETKVVSGYVGPGSNGTKETRRIKEDSTSPKQYAHRQAFQLQPLMYSKIGSVEHIQSWIDCINELNSLGIDVNEFKEWCQLLKFNWVPPVDLDKLVNYQNYYWYDPISSNSTPQYITVKNIAAIAQSYYNFIQSLIGTYGADFRILTGVSPDTLKIRYNYSELFKPGLKLHIQHTALSVIPDFIPFEVTIVSSEYDLNTNLTTIKIEELIGPSVTGSNLTLSVLLDIAQAELNCLLSGVSGWDSNGWDSSSWSGTCVDPVVSKELNQWIGENKWIHKNDLSNFGSARIAKYPIIEYEQNLELNEWNFSNSRWKYRKELDGVFSLIPQNPTVFELKPFEIDVTSDIDVTGPFIRFGSEFGDLTKFLVPGTKLTGFKTNGTIFVDYISVISSEYTSAAPGEIYQTYVSISILDKNLLISNNVDLLTPTKTSFGDVWRGYHSHWLYDGMDDSIPSLKRVENKFLSEFGPIITTPNYTYSLNKFAQSFATLSSMTDFVLDISLQNIAIIDKDDIRVYIDGTRVYGDYSEKTQLDLGIGTDNIFIVGIQFNFAIPSGKYVIIEVGSASLEEIGLTSMEVRTIESDEEFNQAKLLGEELDWVSLIEYRKSEQIKTAINQYPLFDLYDIFGNSAFLANQLFGYKENQDSSFVSDIGLRIERNSATKNFMFEQFLLGPSDETLAYRDYSTIEPEFWYDSKNKIVKSWTGKTWSIFAEQGLRFSEILISPVAPTNKFDGMLWYCVENDTLTRYEYSILGFTDIIIGHLTSTFDPTLKTVWRKGNNDEKYIPKYVDSKKVEVPVGSETGEWEIPDPMYFNPLHDNRRNISLTQISDHFNSIIKVQYVHPSFEGDPSNYYHLLYPNEINFGIGGNIKEYLGGFDTFLSSLFINSVNMPELFNFEYAQHMGALNKIKLIYLDSLSSSLTSFDPFDSKAYKTEITRLVIDTFEANTYRASIYGDSTSYDELTNTGIKYFPTTTSFIGSSLKTKPYSIQDVKLNINKIISHDGQLITGNLDQLILSQAIKELLLIEDLGVPTETIGRVSSTEPPADLIQFNASFSPELRTNLFWFNNSSNTLYKLALSIVGDVIPASAFPSGSLWFDTTAGLETLRIKSGLTWNPVFPAGSGKLYDFNLSSISAWEKIDLTQLYMDVQSEIETRLYDVSPDSGLKIDIESIKTTQKYKDSEKEKFLSFAHSINVVDPLANTEYVSSDAFTWNYKYSVPLTNPSTDPFVSGGCWEDLYEKNFGSAYPHLEPWKLQEYTSKPDWWDSEYLNNDVITYGTRRWKHLANVGMWTNIRTGVVPTGKILPDGLTPSSGLVGEVKTWVYVPVNTSDTPDTLGGQPDDLIPPYIGGTYNQYARSIYSNISEIVKNNLDYTYGDQGTNEWKWKHSIRFNYAVLLINYEIDPINTIYKLFGFDTAIINGLEFDTRTKMVPAHGRTKFHGEILPGGTQYIVNGLNQWMINFNRFTGYDSGFSDFSQKWTSWQVPLAYQFDSFLDKTSFEIHHDNLDLSSTDYSINSKKSPGVRTSRIDALNVTVLKIPPSVTRYDNQSEWKFSVSTYSPLGNTLEYYDVLKYPMYINPVTDTVMLYTYQIALVDIPNNTIAVPGDQREIFTPGRSVSILQSSLNDGIYEVVSGTLDPQNAYTIVKLLQPIPSFINDGIVRADVKSMSIKPTITVHDFASYFTNTISQYYPFELGTEMYLSSTGMLPKEIEDTALPYFLIPKDGSNTEFYLADTYNEALENVAINFSGTGSGFHEIGKVFRKFQVKNGIKIPNEFFEYETDKTITKRFTPPHEINGLQNLLDLIFGYSRRQRDLGFLINNDKELIDQDTGHPVEWEVEVERFLDNLNNVRNQKLAPVKERYEANVDPFSNTWRFIGEKPQFATGTRIILFTSGIVPDPLVKGLPYFIIRDTDTTFRIAATYDHAIAENPITMVPTAGIGTLYWMSANLTLTSYPSFEINPMRNGIWFKPGNGIVSNMITGPFETKKQLIFDQYRRPIEQKHIKVFREDKLTKVLVSDRIANDIDPLKSKFDAYSYLHISGVQFFIDEYEHVLLFNYYTISGDMIYDPFLGVNVSKFWLDFSKQPISTGRPNVGGHYLREDNNLYPNFEKSVDDMRYYYDTFIQSETNERARQSRALLGYEGTKGYLDHINIRSKSQLLFYRGMIHHKGTTSAIKAFINSRKFEGASIDEFWAFKIADFGSAAEKEYPEIFLKPLDARQNEIKFHFSDNTNSIANGYTQISLADKTRWSTTPENALMLHDEGSALYFTLKPVNVAVIDILPDTFGVSPFGLNYTTLGNIDFNGNYIRHNFKSDYIGVSIDIPHSEINVNVQVPPVVTHDIIVQEFIPNTGMITVFRNGILQVINVDYYEAILPSLLLSNKLIFTNALYNDEITVTYGRGQLIPNIHFEEINSRIIKLNYSFNSGTKLTLSGFMFDARAQSPVRFIDDISETTIETIQYWDPARKFFDHDINKSIDIVSDVDPAQYTDSTIKNIPEDAVETYIFGDSHWNKTEVGTTWLDTSMFNHVPYYDSSIYSDDEILKNWGRLSDWSVPLVYEWVESTLTPNEWDVQSNKQVNQTLQSEDQSKVSGTARKMVLKTDFSNGWYEYKPVLETLDPVMDSTGGIDYTFMLNLIPKFSMRIVGFKNSERIIQVTGDYVDDELISLASIRIIDGLNMGDYVVESAVYDVDTGFTDITVTIDIPFTDEDYVDPTILGTVQFYPRVSVFVNGFLKNVNVQPEYTGQLIVSNITESDTLTIGFFPSLSLTNIQKGIDNEVYSYEVQYSRTLEMADVQTGLIKNYFWVSSKIEKTKNHPLSIKEVANGLIEIDKPYVFFTGLVDTLKNNLIGYDVTPFGTIYEEGAGVDPYTVSQLDKIGKIDTFTATESPYNKFNLSFVPYNITGVFDDTSGGYLTPSEYTITGQTITILNPMILGQKINIEYEYLVSGINKPVRFERLVLRGMRGRIFQDRRFILQFVRDFTLRSDMNQGNTLLELKNLHEEWTMIREKQLSNIPRYLWDKIIESMIGYTLANSSIRVPSLDRELYDLSYFTDTRFGMGDGQAFVPGEMAINNIIYDLNRSDIDFSPINPGYFLESHNYLATNADIIAAMDELYNTFGNVHVNRIFFSILHDSFASKIRYSDVFKTSWVALNGIRILETAGVVND